MPLHPTQGYQSLRRGRVSEAGFDYFITFCTADRSHGLSDSKIAEAMLAECRAMQADAVWTLRCGTVMPDHLHLLITLGNKVPLGKAVARLKSRTSALLRAAGLTWQSGYFDHRLRPHEDILPYFLYTYLNPYRAGLISHESEWPWLACKPEDREWFMPLLNHGLPEPEWLMGLP